MMSGNVGKKCIFYYKNMSGSVQSLQISIILKKAVPKGTLCLYFSAFLKKAQVSHIPL